MLLSRGVRMHPLTDSLGSTGKGPKTLGIVYTGAAGAAGAAVVVAVGGNDGGAGRAEGRHAEVGRSRKRMGSGFLLFFLAPMTKSASECLPCGQNRAERGQTQRCRGSTQSLHQGPRRRAS